MDNEAQLAVDNLIHKRLADLQLPPLHEFSFDFLKANLNKHECGDWTATRLTDWLNQIVDDGWERVCRILRFKARQRLLAIGHSIASENLDELVQKAIEKWHGSSPGFRGSTEKEFISWLLTTVDRLIQDIDRGRGAEQKERNWKSLDRLVETWSTCAGINVPDETVDTPSAFARQSEAVHDLYVAIESLPMPVPEIVQRYMNQQTFDEISVAMSIPRATVARQYHRALTDLRKQLRGHA